MLYFKDMVVFVHAIYLPQVKNLGRSCKGTVVEDVERYDDNFFNSCLSELII